MQNGTENEGVSALGGEYRCKEYSNKLSDMTNEKRDVVRTSNLVRICVQVHNICVCEGWQARPLSWKQALNSYKIRDCNHKEKPGPGR